MRPRQILRAQLIEFSVLRACEDACRSRLHADDAEEDARDPVVGLHRAVDGVSDSAVRSDQKLIVGELEARVHELERRARSSSRFDPRARNAPSPVHGEETRTRTG